MENLTLCEVCVCEQVCDRLRAVGPTCECEHFYHKPTKHRTAMTNKEAEEVLMNLDKYIEFDEDYGVLERAPLVDATLLAIKALRKQPICAKWRKTRMDEPDGTYYFLFKCSRCDGFSARQRNFCSQCGSEMEFLEDEE